MLGLVFATALYVSLAADRPAVAQSEFYVIVNRSNAIASVPREELSDVFMKRVRSWPDRSDILPVDQPVRSRVRDAFSRYVHGKSVAFVTRYWQRLIFSGRAIPPPEVSSDAAVVEFVTKNRGAIGYISDPSRVTDAVKVIEVAP